MAAGDKYFDCNKSNIGTGQLLKLLTAIDENSKPFFRNNKLNEDFIPPAPYAVFSEDNIHVLNSINGISYFSGSGPSSPTANFYLLGKGLNTGNITITPDSNFNSYFEIFNPNASPPAYTSSLFTIHTTGTTNIFGFKIRVKAGLAANNYNGSITITAANALPFTLNVTGNVIALTYIVATGGIMSQVGNRKVHKFNTTEDFIITSISNDITLNYLWVLCVAGGAGGGGFDGVGSGFSAPCGGGGGGVKEVFNYYITSTGTIIATVGIGGPGGFKSGGSTYKGTNGQDSTFGTITSHGGGYGAGAIDGIAGGNGGSGGGSMFGFPAGQGTVGEGHNGGIATDATPNYGGGGGGGAGAIGQNGTGISGGDGGDGISSNITGVLTYYGGGGGGGVYVGGTYGNGGIGGGGAAGQPILGLTTGEDGEQNTGGGGGSASHPGGNLGVPCPGGDGANGVIIVSYISP